jgi:hypothetical protein
MRVLWAPTDNYVINYNKNDKLMLGLSFLFV